MTGRRLNPSTEPNSKDKMAVQKCSNAAGVMVDWPCDGVSYAGVRAVGMNEPGIVERNSFRSAGDGDRSRMGGERNEFRSTTGASLHAPGHGIDLLSFVPMARMLRD
jgi:hypothetical protein